MSLIHVGSEHDTSYSPARGSVLLLSCMDLRLLNEIVQFMDHDGLTNRYDHVILAGAALGASAGKSDERRHWKKTFFDHVQIAYDLHHIQDVYILEHRDCGAYQTFLGKKGEFDDTQLEEEANCHRKFARALRKEIATWADEARVKLRVTSFLMDLRGLVSLLDPPKTVGRRSRQKR